MKVVAARSRPFCLSNYFAIGEFFQLLGPDHKRSGAFTFGFWSRLG